MKTSEFIDIEKLETAIKDIRLKRDILIKDQASLRVKESRLKKLLAQATEPPT